MSYAKFRDYSVGKKLGIIEAGIVILLMTLFTLFVVGYTRSILDRSMEQDLRRQALSARNLIEVYSNDVKGSTEKLANVFISYFPGKFSLEKGKAVRIGSVDTPLLKTAGSALNLNFTAVDRFTGMTGGVATVFARSGDDFVRIATSLKKEDGGRAIGTLLGKEHPGYQLLMKGEPYLGRATLFGREYSTKYEPIKAAEGEVIGILFVGYEITDGLKFLKEKIKSIKIGKTGYIYALNSTPGPKYGTLLIHPSEEGKNILDAKDSRGREFIKDILEKKEGIIRYPWINKERGETAARDKVVVFTPFAEWNMVIGAGGYEDELYKDIAALRIYVICAALAMAGMLIVLLNLAAKRMVTIPLQRAVQFAQTVAEGNLTTTLQVSDNDEVGQLSRALNAMVASLQGMIGKIRDASAMVASAAGEISKSSAQLTKAAHGQASTSEKTSATMVQMAASIQTVAMNADSLASNADEVSASIQELGASSEQVAKSA
ncbi:MAG TPA: methyl-accepting chemotaxis protein, partial [Geobacteraceae bacterium]